jgi:hypothetical protein
MVLPFVTVGIRFLIADLEEISLEEAELSRWPRSEKNSRSNMVLPLAKGEIRTLTVHFEKIS